MAKKSKSNSRETHVSEIQPFFKKTRKAIMALTVKDMLDEQIAYK